MAIFRHYRHQTGLARRWQSSSHRVDGILISDKCAPGPFQRGAHPLAFA
jgi:hypothetical protein